MKKNIKYFALLFLMLAVLGGPGAAGVSAATAPSVNIVKNNAVIARLPGQTEFDLSEIYSVDFGTFAENEVTIDLAVEKDGMNMPADAVAENKIPFAVGEYKLTVLLTYTDGQTRYKTGSAEFELYMDAPVFRNADSIGGYKEFNVQKNQAMIDLRVLYRINANSYSEDEYKVSYSVSYPGREVQIFGHHISAVSGYYNIIVTLSPVNAGAFEPITAPEIILKVQKLRPAVVFEYEGETEKIQIIDNKYTVDIYNAATPIELNRVYTIYGNAYVSNEYAASVLVRKKISETETENVQVFDARIAAVPGVYYIVVKINPRIQGAFSPVTSEELELTVRKALPDIAVRSDVYAARNNALAIGNYVSVSAGGYESSEVKITTAVRKGGKTVDIDNGAFNAKPGVYTVTVSIAPVTAGEFEQVSQTFTIHVSGLPGYALALIIAGGVLVLGGAAAAVVILSRKKRGKRIA